jgi:acetoin utilization protein AcuC
MLKTLVDPNQLLRFDFGVHHPFKVYRLGLTYDLMNAYGLIDREDVRLIPARLAEESEATVFHSTGYLEALRLASSGMWVPNQFAHGLGTSDNPVFPDVYEWGMTVAGSSIDAAAALLEPDMERAFNMTGGLHHAMPTRASGFCHVNDGVLAIHRLLAAGKRVVYVDIDAHHGDGVQQGFYDDDRVLTISIHQTGYTLFPGTGFADETGQGEGLGYAVNLPLLPGAGDEAYDRAFDEAILPLIELFEPDALVTQMGADAILGDVLANLRLSLRGFERAAKRFAALRKPWLALGGGGYDVSNVVRAWTLVWSTMLNETLPDEVPVGWQTEAATYGLSVSRLRGGDETPPTPAHVLEDLDGTLDQIRQGVFPTLEEARRTRA